MARRVKKAQSMNFKALVFRSREPMIALIYVLGFVAPWEYLLSRSRPATLWLSASTLLARTGWMDLAVSTALVTVTALCCCFLGATLRVWGTAYLSPSLMLDSAMHGDRVVAAGPYRFLRNPLYLGSCLFATGAAILMPLSGAIFFLVCFYLLHLFLIFTEEEFLSLQGGEFYREYRERVPRLWAGLHPAIPSSGARPDWLQSLFAEIYSIGFTLCFAILAWRYNAMLLIKCLIVCYGLSLIARAVLLPAPRRVKSEIV